jgi:hypothetical protein
MRDITNRTLEQIGFDLSNVIQNQTSGMLRTGKLLNEAKELASHGEWLPFLALHRIEERSAQNYMRAATWADTKSETVSYFDLGKIAPKAIYELATGRYSDDVVEQVISAAQHRHIGISDVRAIAQTGEKAPILREIKEAKAAAAATAKAAAAKAKATTVEARGANTVRQAAEDGDVDDGSEDTEDSDEQAKADHVLDFETACDQYLPLMTLEERAGALAYAKSVIRRSPAPADTVAPAPKIDPSKLN